MPRKMAARSLAGRPQRGFTYLGVLLAVALIGLGLTMASEVWVSVSHRQKLVQLDFAGQQIVQAVGSYYESTPGPAKRFPQSLEDLLEDRRSPVVRRHLRKIYANPFGSEGRWELLAASEGGIAGVAAVVPKVDGSTSLSIEYAYPRQRVALPQRMAIPR